MTTRDAEKPSTSYDAVGVSTLRVDGGLGELAHWVHKTFAFNRARPELPLGYYANVLRLRADLGLAISTDSVGTKVLVAEQVGKFDTIGIDCVAMNANDVLCVGAEPISMVDFIAVERAEPRFLAELAKGLYEGARQAAINIPGGEVAQVREIIRGTGEGTGFELVGTCVGLVHPDKIIIGRDVRPGDVVVALASTGIHSNGITLARHVLLNQARLPLAGRVPELGRTLGEELLEPTRIYVKPVVEMLAAGLKIKALIHVTGDGFLNLARVEAEVGFVVDQLMAIPPIFDLVQERGGLADAEMFKVYNMGIGFCIVVDPKDAERVGEIAARHGDTAAVVGYAVADPQRRIWIPQRQLVSGESDFQPLDHSAPPRPATP